MHRTKWLLIGTLVIVATLQICFWAPPVQAETGEKPLPYNVGQWLPSDQQALEDWRADLIRKTDALAEDTSLLPVIQEFKELIDNDPELFMLFTQMFEQVPQKPPFLTDPTGKPQIRDYQHMLGLMNQILTQAPEFNKTGLVGFPINAILDWPMATPAGTSAFLNEKVNRQLKKILNQWAVFLASPDSRDVLTDHPKNGWFGRDAREAMPTFVEDFNCDPDQPHYGFESWDDFFTRTLEWTAARRDPLHASDFVAGSRTMRQACSGQPQPRSC